MACYLFRLPSAPSGSLAGDLVAAGQWFHFFVIHAMQAAEVVVPVSSLTKYVVLCDHNAVGVAAIHITVGESELDHFTKLQENNRLMKRKVFERVDVDLSLPLPADQEEASVEAMSQRKTDDFMAGM